MTWTDPATWYANLASFYAAAAAFITDPDGNVLLVKPTYRDHWAFPGGYVDEGEYPHDACAREIREELGFLAVVGDLLVADWAPPAGQRPRAIISFTFDCGSIATLDGLHLQGHELEDVAFFPPQEAEQRLPGNVATRVRAAMHARDRHAPVYLAGGSAVWLPPGDAEGCEACPTRQTP
ncbi:NUDIX domain-containing protein [Micromonospora zamorensis]|uniref:NUDIX domain-containing protein n=1 Tax=Micromonospora zamorensis TaxID=709883 RepID=UPI00081F973E|nr:NUDIX hydrolase [Micromonospora zamorensis]SCG49209.1 ADP-ribose pyrophosphatase YjhB, NUDIX family [Micromonospora zamorensis]